MSNQFEEAVELAIAAVSDSERSADRKLLISAHNQAIADVLFGIMEVISNEYDEAMEHPDDTDSSSAYAHAYVILKSNFFKYEQEKE